MHTQKNFESWQDFYSYTVLREYAAGKAFKPTGPVRQDNQAGFKGHGTNAAIGIRERSERTGIKPPHPCAAVDRSLAADLTVFRGPNCESTTTTASEGQVLLATQSAIH